MRIACVGGGPAGLYFALLMKLRDPGHEITIFERSAAGSTYGWGVVFWDDLLEKLYSSDPRSAREIDQAAFRWVNQVVDVQGEQVLHAGSRGYSINRQRLLDILAGRAQAPRCAYRVRSGGDGPFAAAGGGSHRRLRWREQPDTA